MVTVWGGEPIGNKEFNPFVRLGHCESTRCVAHSVPRLPIRSPHASGKSAESMVLPQVRARHGPNLLLVAHSISYRSASLQKLMGLVDYGSSSEDSDVEDQSNGATSAVIQSGTPCKRK